MLRLHYITHRITKNHGCYGLTLFVGVLKIYKNSGGSQPFVHDHGHRNIRHVTIRKGVELVCGFCDVINRLFTPNLISNAYGQLWRDIEFLLL